jgi:hypothetical protein
MTSQLQLPVNYQIALVLKNIVAIGDQVSKRVQRVTPFNSSSVPLIEIDTYFLVVAERLGLQNEQALAVPILIDRFTRHEFECGNIFVVNSYTAHR